MDYSKLQSRASTSTSSHIPPHRTQIHPRLLTTTPNPKLQFPYSRRQQKWIVLVASLLTLPFVFYLFSTARKIHVHTPSHTTARIETTAFQKSFGVVIHSGVTRAEIRVFEYDARFKFDARGENCKDFKMVRERGDVKKMVLELVKFAKGRVPKEVRGRTKVVLFADEEEMEVLEECREVLRFSGFWFKNEWASVIKGVDKGVFAWVAVNYDLGLLGYARRETTGIVDLGGTDIQIVFALKDPKPTRFSRTLKYSGVTYNLHAQSLHQFGQDVAWQTFHKKLNSRDGTTFLDANYRNPCLPRGFSIISNSSDLAYISGGNFSACRGEAVSLLKETNGYCLQPPCKITTSAFVELRAKHVLPENFIYVSKSFGVLPEATLTEVEAAGKKFCEDHWQDQRHRLPYLDEFDPSRYCFTSAYIVALLHDTLGIKVNNGRVGFSRNSAIIPHDWTMGAFVLQMMQESQQKETHDSKEIVGSDSISIFILFSLLLIVVLGAFFALKLRRPQVKTIYDLEKGRYIITRVPR